MRRMIAAALLGLSLAFSASSSYALPIGANGSGKTMQDLKDAGYTCERVATNFIECTKSGESTYWCTDDGTCEQAPARSGPRGGLKQTGAALNDSPAVLAP